MIEKYDKFKPLYDQLGNIVQPSLETKEHIAIKIEDILKAADSLNIDIYESEIDSLLRGMNIYFLSLGIITEKTETVPEGEIVISFTRASDEEIKYGLYLEVYQILGDIIQKYRESIPSIIPESKFSGAYKKLEETFEEILASKKPFAIYTSDFLKYTEKLIPNELKDHFKPEIFLEGLEWYLEDREQIAMDISPLITMEKGDLIVDILVFQKID